MPIRAINMWRSRLHALGRLREVRSEVRSAHSDSDSKNLFLCLPPPNLTGEKDIKGAKYADILRGRLHVGHALTLAVEEALVRRASQGGGGATFVPGFDHAGIATQLTLTRHLRKAGLGPESLSRDLLLQHAQEWTEMRMAEITEQLLLLNAQLDWDKAYYTMDPTFSRAVRRAFVQLHKLGLIYRATRLVHWSPYLQSTLSKSEVETKLIETPQELKLPSGESIEVGWMYQIQYPILGSKNKSVTVATTRPETMLGDVAVAVHPSDERYSELLRQETRLRHPLIPGSSIPLIADESVDPHLGTGALKITPAHDWADWEIGSRHGLAASAPRCLDDAGRLMSDEAGLDGLSRGAARPAVLAALGHLYAGRAEHRQSLPVCSRSGDLIEAMGKPQWVLRTTGLVDAAELRSGLELRPAWAWRELESWLGAEEDWCLSRQLWWGHQVPAWRDAQDEWVVAEEDPGTPGLIRDTDVLDTWFSSALVPLVVRGWPDVQRPPPISTLVSGHDILGFWIARMILMSKALTGQLPFKKVVLHSIVADEKNRKMSKSVGNVIDPIELIQSPMSGKTPSLKAAPCGSDWLKFSLLSHDSSARFVSFNVRRSEAHLHLQFKLRNSLKFWRSQAWAREVVPVMTPQLMPKLEPGELEAWVDVKLRRTVGAVAAAFDADRLHEATAALETFYWHDFCDVYLEAVKAELADRKRVTTICRVASKVNNQFLRCLYPFMPELSEELWAEYSEIQNSLDKIVSLPSLPVPTSEPIRADEARLEASVDGSLELVRGVWGLLGQLGLGKRTSVEVGLVGAASAQRNSALLRRIADIGFSEDTPTEMVRQGALPIWLSPELTAFVRIPSLTEEGEAMIRLSTQLQTKQKKLDYAESRILSQAKNQFKQKTKRQILFAQHSREKFLATSQTLGEEVASIAATIAFVEKTLQDDPA